MRQIFVNVRGLNIRYLETGNVLESAGDSGAATIDDASKKHHVLFVHGLGSSADRWLDIPDALSISGLHSVSLDLPGFGLSNKPEMDYTIDKFVEIVADFIRETGMQGTSIVGHSLGGYIAAQLTSELGDLVDRLILINTSGMLEGPTPLLKQYLDVAMKPEKEAVRALLEQLVADPIRISEALVDGFIYRMSQIGSKHAFKSAYEYSVNTQIGDDRLKRIKAPTLIIWGRHDRLIPIKYFKPFQELISSSTVVIVEDAGHAPFAEKPAIVFELLRRFLIEKQ